MKRGLWSLTVLGAALALSAAPAAAQHARLDLGAGGVMPTGDYATADNAGWQLMGAVELGIPRSPLAVRVDGMYGQTSHQGSIPFTNNTKLSGGSADALYRIGAPMVPVKLYLLAGLGYYKVDLGGGISSSNVAWNGGAGLRLGVGPMGVFGEVRYISVLTSGGSTNFLPVTVGLSFGM